MTRSILVGRDSELELAAGAIKDLKRGVGCLIVVKGPGGIGKTSFLEAVIDLGVRARVLVAPARAGELDSGDPATTLMAVLHRLVEAGLSLSRVGRYDARRPRKFIDALAARLEEHAVTRPLLFVIDDMQLADEISSFAIGIMTRRLQSSAIAWVLAHRAPVDPSPGTDAIEQLRDISREVALDPLDHCAVQRLCQSRLRGRPDEHFRQVLDRAGGHPFFLETLIAGLRSADRIAVKRGVASCAGDEVPQNVVDAINFRLGMLTPDCRRLLQAGSVFRGRFTIDGAARLLRTPPTALLAATYEAIVANLLIPNDVHYLTFAHELVRETVYEGTHGPVRTAMHRAAVAIVQGEGGSAAEAAWHVQRSGPRADKKAVRLLWRAATEMTDYAPAAAAELVLHALKIMNPRDPDRPRLCAEGVSLLAAAGCIDEALGVGQQALQGQLDPMTEVSLRCGLAEALKHAGRNQAALDYAEPGLRVDGVPDALRARLWAVIAHARLYAHGAVGADEAGAKADSLGLLGRDPAASVYGNAARSVVARSEGRLADALTHSRKAVETADQFGREARHRHPRLWLGPTLASLDQFAAAEEAYAVVRREIEELGTAWAEPLLQFHYASLQAAKGQLDAAAAEARLGLVGANRSHARQLCVPLHGLLAVIAIQRDELASAQGHLHELKRLMDEGITAAPELTAWPQAVCLEVEGRPAAAVDRLSVVYDNLHQRSLILSHDPGCAPALVRLALAARDFDRAGMVVSATRRLADQNSEVASLVGAAYQAEALMDGELETLLEAVRCLRCSPRRLLLAGALEDAAAAAHRKHRLDAVEYLHDALDLYTECGAKRAIERVRRRRTVIGASARDMRHGAVAVQQRLNLSQTQLRVAQLAITMTKAQIAKTLKMSESAVDNHLRKIYAKLQLNSRVKLASRLRDAEDGLDSRSAG